VVGLVAGLVIPGIRSTTISDPEDCTTENNCAIIPFNGSSYQVTGIAYKIYQECLSTIRTSPCSWQTVNGTTYSLQGKAYDAYLILDNTVLPLHKIRYDSQYINDRPYLINVEGPSTEVNEIVSRYDIVENDTKSSSDSNWLTYYGWIYKKDLIALLDENTVESLVEKSVTITPVGGYDTGSGMVYGIPPQLPDPEQFMVERSTFTQKELSKIILQKDGVTRLPNEDFKNLPDYHKELIEREFN
jgi:hypothetical protein